MSLGWDFIAGIVTLLILARLLGSGIRRIFSRQKKGKELRVVAGSDYEHVPATRLPPYTNRNQTIRSRARAAKEYLGLIFAGVILLGALTIGASREFGNRATRTGSMLEGRVTHVRDGDTIEVGGVPVRLATLDCAEKGTAKGNAATVEMRSIASGKSATCYLQGRRSYDREIGTCTIEGVGDVGTYMRQGGWCERFW